MNWKEFYDKAKGGIAFSDGAMGVIIQAMGLGEEVPPEDWNLSHQDEIYSIHKQYVDVGVEMLTTNTIGGNRIKLSHYGLDDRVFDINFNASKIAKKASNGKAIVAGSVGPTGKFIKPIGDISFDEVVDVYKEQIIALAEGGADAIVFETHVDILELKAGIIALKECSNLPFIANMTFEKDGRSVTGTPPEVAFATLEALGADIIGTNCSTGPSDMAELIKKWRPYFNVPIIAQANAGMPRILNGKTVFDQTPDVFAENASVMADYGINVIGGCCGTTPEHIGCLIKSVNNKNVPSMQINNRGLKISSRYALKYMGFDYPFIAIGERLNPTARKKLAADIIEGRFGYFKDEALAQEANGADILDLNMGIPSVNEAELMEKGVEILTTASKIPLAIDSADTETCRRGMRFYPGAGILNSISAEEERLALLTDVKKYGFSFIALPVDNNGIPKTADGRIKLLKKIIDRAKEAGIDKSKIIADALVLTASAEQDSAAVTLETIRRAKEELGLLTVCGLSNISFGLPARGFINRSFLSMAVANGLTSAIVNPLDEQIMGEIRASDVLLSKDKNSEKYISLYAGYKENLSVSVSDKGNKTVDKTPDTLEGYLYDAVVKGNKDTILQYVKEALDKGYQAVDILDKYLVPAINYVGELYEKRIYFLPQLMMSAETMKTAFSYLEPMLKHGAKKSLGKIIFATVKGDVHDIGKNIVIIMLRNYGFEVIDLGRDVACDVIIDKAKETNADIVALSALMTTTMPRMKEFMDIKQAVLPDLKVMVGGAAVTLEFADSIGAFYSSDAVGAVKLAETLVKAK
jgi:5-methyltetrahydrofolate--homocysteine methyltransferase